MGKLGTIKHANVASFGLTIDLFICIRIRIRICIRIDRAEGYWSTLCETAKRGENGNPQAALDPTCGNKAIHEMAALCCGPKSKAIFESMYKTLQGRPQTFIHSDLRADNIFKPGKGEGAESNFTLIDWQLFIAGPPGCEMVQLLMGGLSSEKVGKETL